MAPWFNWWGSSAEATTTGAQADFGISRDQTFESVTVERVFTCPRANVAGDAPPPATPTNLNGNASTNPGQYPLGSVVFNEANNSLYVRVLNAGVPAWAGITSTA